eukprot:2741215-Amphidinium_carterae.1
MWEASRRKGKARSESTIAKVSLRSGSARSILRLSRLTHSIGMTTTHDTTWDRLCMCANTPRKLAFLLRSVVGGPHVSCSFLSQRAPEHARVNYLAAFQPRLDLSHSIIYACLVAIVDPPGRDGAV